jgi:hypothetical protein
MDTQIQAYNKCIIIYIGSFYYIWSGFVLLFTPTDPSTPLHLHDDTAPQVTKAHDFQSDALKKEMTPIPPASLLRINEQMFPPGRHEPKQEASQHNASKEGHDARRRRRC